MNRIILITGEKNSGKTSYLKHFIEKVALNENLSFGGFISEGIFNSGRLSGYNLIELIHQDKRLLCSDTPKTGSLRIGKYYFDPEGFRFGEEILLKLPEGTEWILIDEYGPVELSGEGWSKTIDQLLKKEGVNLMITVRLELLAEVIDKFQGYEIHVFNVCRSDFSRITTAIKKLIPS